MWKQTKIWLYQIDTLLCSNKVRDFGEPGPSAKKMATEYIVLWSNWLPSPRIGLNKFYWNKGTLSEDDCLNSTSKLWERWYLSSRGAVLIWHSCNTNLAVYKIKKILQSMFKIVSMFSEGNKSLGVSKWCISIAFGDDSDNYGTNTRISLWYILQQILKWRNF